MFERTRDLLNSYPEGDIKTGRSTLLHINKILTTLADEAEKAITDRPKAGRKAKDAGGVQ
jgi:hypothetical protein